MVLDKEGILSGSTLDAAFVFPKASVRVRLRTLKELVLAGLDVFVFSAPCLDGGCLESAAVRERQRPRLLPLQFVHSVKVNRRFFFGLAAGEEYDARNSSWHSALQSRDGGFGNVNWSTFLRAGLAWGAHIRLEQSALKEDIVIVESLVNCSQNFLGNLLAGYEVVIAVGKDLGFDNWHNAVLLAFRRIPA